MINKDDLAENKAHDLLFCEFTDDDYEKASNCFEKMGEDFIDYGFVFCYSLKNKIADIVKGRVPYSVIAEFEDEASGESEKLFFRLCLILDNLNKLNFDEPTVNVNDFILNLKIGVIITKNLIFSEEKYSKIEQQNKLECDSFDEYLDKCEELEDQIIELVKEKTDSQYIDKFIEINDKQLFLKDASTYYYLQQKLNELEKLLKQ